MRFGRHWAVRDLDFTVRAGERWLVTGPNGSGKTVLLRLLRGELWPTPTGRERRLYRLGRECDEQPGAARSRIAYLGPERQDKYARHGWDLTVREVVGTGLFDTDIPLDHMDARGARAVTAALEGARLAGLARRRFLTLSYGQRRRVLLARALVRRPDVLLLDEALNGLDTASRRVFLRQLHRTADERSAWVLTTHRPGDRPADVTHVAGIEAGRIVESGAVERGRGASRNGREPDRRHRRRAVRAGDGPNRDATDVVRLRRASVYRDERLVIPRLDWTLRAGEHWCITGPNGSGKSTLLALLYGDLWPAQGGTIERPSLPGGAPISEWKNSVGLVSPELQTLYATTACTVEEIVLSGLHSSIGLNDRPTPAERTSARRALASLGLLALSKRRARELSYGQLRRALFARAIVAPRRLLLLDEWLEGLDDATRHRLRDRLAAAVAAGTQVVVATHHREDVPDFVRHGLALDGRGRARVSARGDVAGRGAVRRGPRGAHRPA